MHTIAKNDTIFQLNMAKIITQDFGKYFCLSMNTRISKEVKKMAYLLDRYKNMTKELSTI